MENTKTGRRLTRPPVNVVLIGMPGSGKSTVGVILAKDLGWSFTDTDILIQVLTGRALQDIVDRDGYMKLRDIEEDAILTLKCAKNVIATGGSAAYSRAAMRHLARRSLVVFLDASIAALKSRIHDYETRGIARRPDQSFEDLYHERRALYLLYADEVVECSSMNAGRTCEAIGRIVRSRWGDSLAD